MADNVPENNNQNNGLSENTEEQTTKETSNITSSQVQPANSQPLSDDSIIVKTIDHRSDANNSDDSSNLIQNIKPTYTPQESLINSNKIQQNPVPTMSAEQPVIINKPTQSSQIPSGTQFANVQPNKNRIKLILLFVLILIILGAGGYLVYAKYFKSKPVKTQTPTTSTTVSQIQPKAGWQAISGCVQPLDTNIQVNYRLNLLDDYQVVDNDSGCGKKQYDEILYMPTGSNVPGSTNYATIDISISKLQAESPGETPNDAVYFQVPSPNGDYYLSIHRTETKTDGNITLQGVSDEDWSIIKQSFKF